MFIVLLVLLCGLLIYPDLTRRILTDQSMSSKEKIISVGVLTGEEQMWKFVYKLKYYLFKNFLSIVSMQSVIVASKD